MTDEATSIEPLLSALRGDVQPMSAPVRERLALRLASASVVAAGAATLASAGLFRGFWRSRVLTAAVALPLGVLVGAAGHAYLAPTAVKLVTTPRAGSLRVVLVPTPAAPSAVVRAPVTPSVSPPDPPASSGARPRAAQPSLEAELALLERARGKLSEGEPHATLQLLREHQAQYPASALQQEREALAIRALLAAGRRAEAQRRTQAFVRAYPNSALRGSIERAAGTIP